MPSAAVSNVVSTAISPGAEQKPASTLVIYIFSKTDTEYEDNLMFFIKHGVAENDGCDYIFILQLTDGVQVGCAAFAADTMLAAAMTLRWLLPLPNVRGSCMRMQLHPQHM